MQSKTDNTVPRNSPSPSFYLALKKGSQLFTDWQSCSHKGNRHDKVSRFPLKDWLPVDNVSSGSARYSVITLIFHRILLWSRRPTGQIRKNVLSIMLRKIAFRSSGKSPENLKRISDFEVGVGVARGCHVFKGPWVEWDHYHSNRPDFPW